MSAARVLALLELLQAHPGLTGPQLAARLEVDARTVRRLVATLDGLGVPVLANRGKYGGYRLMPGYKLPPLMLTRDEAVAVVLGLLAAERTGLHAAATSLASARAKIDRVLPDELRERTRAVAETLGFSMRTRQPAAPDSHVLLTLGEAARDHHRVRIAYTSWRGEASERELDPFGLVFHSGRWYVTGHDHRRDGVRTFRLDRIASADPIGAGTPPPEGFDPVGTVMAGISEVPWATAVTIVLHAPPDEVRARLPRTAGTLEPHPDGTLLRSRAQRLDGLARMLAGLGWRFTVHEPDQLRAELRTLAAHLTADAAR
ncbi:helix-turn-helix transcriptional regulator [Pseudonocardia acaciae]|uniref:helix-turn-helix transcriptional regulator n=1 Tax=Pseudonocardia acaciae TaxID=551276 RepID=UPI000490D316|nr:YafY family protein [Pseudonocardia acaciae]